MSDVIVVISISPLYSRRSSSSTIQRLEFIVHANQGILDIRFGTENATAATRCEGRALRAEAHEIVFSKH